MVDGVVAAAVVHPYTRWDVDLATCGSEALTHADPTAPVRIEYTETGDEATRFGYVWGPVLPYTYSCDPECMAGSCTGNGVCTCDPGFVGAACETTVCEPACAGHGVCAGGPPNVCVCAYSIWSGVNCDVPVCVPTCTGGSTCTAPGVCTPPSLVTYSTYGETTVDLAAGTYTILAWGAAGGPAVLPSPQTRRGGGGGGFAQGTYVHPGGNVVVRVGQGGSQGPNNTAYGGGLLRRHGGQQLLRRRGRRLLGRLPADWRRPGQRQPAEPHADHSGRGLRGRRGGAASRVRRRPSAATRTGATAGPRPPVAPAATSAVATARPARPAGSSRGAVAARGTRPAAAAAAATTAAAAVRTTIRAVVAAAAQPMCARRC